MNLNYNYVQDLGGEKLQRWFTPRVVETKTHSDLPGTLNLEMQQQPVIYSCLQWQKPIYWEEERHATLQKKKRQKNQMHILEQCCIFPPSLTQPQRAQWLICARTGSLFIIKLGHSYLGWEILKHISDKAGRCTNEASENTVVTVFGNPQWS